MRKVFSYFVLALCLIVSTQVKAQNVAKIGDTEYPTLQAAVNAVPCLVAKSEPTTITLLENVTITESKQALVVFDRNIILDLDGHSYTNSGADAIEFLSGTLRIKNSSSDEISSIISSAELDKKSWYTSAIRVFGSRDPQAENYTNLIVESNVLVKSNYRGIDIYTWGNGNKPTDAYNVECTLAATTNNLGYFGGCSEQAALQDANIQSSYGGANYGCGFGVNIDIYGQIEAGVYGVQVSGVVGYGLTPEKVHADPVYWPNIHLHGGSQIVATPSDDKKDSRYPTGVLIGSYAVATIEGGVTGNTGVNIKSGDVTISGDAVISAEGTYDKGKENDGGKSSGSAIMMASVSNRDYPLSLKVEGNPQIKSEHGYAVEEAILTGTDDNTENIIIEGGTFKGSGDKEDGKGCISTTPAIQTKIVESGSISGGTFSYEKIEGEVASYLNQDNGIILPIVNADGETVFVVGEKPKDLNFSTSIADAEAAKKDSCYVKCHASGTILRETLTKNVTVVYLSMTAEGENDSVIITIPAGKTLAAGEIVMDANAQIVVEAGGKLIVNGANGIVAFEPSNLVIKSNSDGVMGTFVYNPNVKANKTPYATVEYYTSQYCGKKTLFGVTENHWEVLASPFASISDINSDPAYFSHIVNGSFVNCTRTDIKNDTKAFDVFAICTNTGQHNPTKFTFQGQLQGATSLEDYSMKQKFNYMGNAYMCALDAKEMVKELQQSESSVRTLIYRWNTKDMKWDVYNNFKLNKLEKLELNPMEAIVLYSDDEGSVNLNYKDLIWENNK